MQEGFCEFDGERVMRWIREDRGRGGSPASNGHPGGGREVEIVEGIIRDDGAIRTEYTLEEEMRFWEMAAAKGMSDILSGGPEFRRLIEEGVISREVAEALAAKHDFVLDTGAVPA